MSDTRPTLQKAYLQIVEPSTAGASGTSAGTATRGAKLIEFKFNPKEFSINKSAKWKAKEAKAAKAPPPEFTGSDPRSLSLEVFLDATDSETGNVMDDVDKLFSCCLPTARAMGRNRPQPPFVLFAWGTFQAFAAYMESVQAKFTLFRPDGTPVRATCQLKLTEVPYEVPRQNPTSGALAAHKVHTVGAGDTLASIAFNEYDDPNLWRALAEYNGIDDPLRVRPGHRLLIPPPEDAGAMN